MLEPLPIDDVLPQIVAALRVNQSVVLRAPTGAGKTTRVPPALLDALVGRPSQADFNEAFDVGRTSSRPGKADLRRVIVLEPRRVAARAAA